MELKILEEYSMAGEKRFRVLVRGTNIILNVEADTEEEALSKARELAEKMGLPEVLGSIKARLG